MTNEVRTTSEPNHVTVIVSPVSTRPPITEEPQTIKDIINNIVKSPLYMTTSIQLSKEIIDVLTDCDRNNDQIVCDLL